MHKVQNDTGFEIKLLPPILEQQWISDAANQFQKNLANPQRSIQRFEKALAAYTGSPYVALVNSGASALHIALLLLNVQKGDEVLCSTFTFAASAFAIKYAQAEPVFIDSENVSWNMDPELLREAIHDRLIRGKRPKAIIVVHSFGMPARMEAILEIAGTYQIPVVEDAAGALGSFYGDRHVGSLGSAGIVSFNYNKIVTTGGGGALLLKNHDDYKKAKYLSTQARSNLPFYEHRNVGFNYQLNHFAAELGICQLENISNLLERKKSVFQFYREKLARKDGIVFCEGEGKTVPNHWLNAILFDSKENREKTAVNLSENKIESRYFWNPMHRQPVFRDCFIYNNGVAEKLFECGLSLPSSSKANLERVTDCIIRS